MPEAESLNFSLASARGVASQGPGCSCSEEGAPLESARVLSGLAATLPLPLAENSYRTLSPQKNAPVWVHIHFRFSFRALPGWPSTVPGTQQELRARLWTG